MATKMTSDQIAALFVARPGQPRGDGATMYSLMAKQAAWLFDVFARETGPVPSRTGRRWAQGVLADGRGWEATEHKYGSAGMVVYSAKEAA